MSPGLFHHSECILELDVFIAEEDLGETLEVGVALGDVCRQSHRRGLDVGAEQHRAGAGGDGAIEHVGIESPGPEANRRDVVTEKLKIMK